MEKLEVTKGLESAQTRRSVVFLDGDDDLRAERGVAAQAQRSECPGTDAIREAVFDVKENVKKEMREMRSNRLGAWLGTRDASGCCCG